MALLEEVARESNAALIVITHDMAVAARAQRAYELYDGTPPFKGHGGMSYAPTVAEILRIVRIINNENNDTQQR